LLIGDSVGCKEDFFFWLVLQENRFFSFASNRGGRHITTLMDDGKKEMERRLPKPGLQFGLCRSQGILLV
jgi:hypothetical protein